MSKLISKLAVGVVLAGALSLGSATASFAFGGNNHYYEPSDNGSVWSFYRGYFDGRNAQASNSARHAYDWSAPEMRNPGRSARHNPN